MALHHILLQPEPTAAQRVYLSDVSWAHYEALLEIRGERATPRITYFDGELELTAPSRNHELIKKTMARLVEANADDRDLVLTGAGSTTLRLEAQKLGLEPDECYYVGEPDDGPPHLALEVVWTRGSLGKLELYQALAVQEVWFWERGRITVHSLQSGPYTVLDHSALLPELDLPLLARLADEPSQTQAVRAWRAALRGPALT